MLCPACGMAEIPEGRTRCPACKAWRRPVRSTAFSSLADIPEKKVNWYGESEGLLKGCFGPGLPQGAILLLGGPPGHGKSTLASQVAARSSLLRKTAYLTTEEPLWQTAGRLRRLAEADSVDYSRLLLASTLDTELASGDLTQIAAEFNFLVVDSLQGLTADLALQLEFIKTVKRLTSKNPEITIVIISHLNKSAQFGGQYGNQYMVDLTASIARDDRDVTRGGYHILAVEKTRFWSLGEVELTMSLHGHFTE